MKNETNEESFSKYMLKGFGVAGAIVGAGMALVLMPIGFTIAGIAAGVVTAGAITGGWAAVAGLAAGITGAFAGWRVGEFAEKPLESISRALGRKAEFGTFNAKDASAIAQARGDKENDWMLSPLYTAKPLFSSFKRAANKLRKQPKTATQNVASSPKP